MDDVSFRKELETLLKKAPKCELAKKIQLILNNYDIELKQEIHIGGTATQTIKNEPGSVAGSSMTSVTVGVEGEGSRISRGEMQRREYWQGPVHNFRVHINKSFKGNICLFGMPPAPYWGKPWGHGGRRRGGGY